MRYFTNRRHILTVGLQKLRQVEPKAGSSNAGVEGEFRECKPALVSERQRVSTPFHLRRNLQRAAVVVQVPRRETAGARGQSGKIYSTVAGESTHCPEDSGAAINSEPALCP